MNKEGVIVNVPSSSTSFTLRRHNNNVSPFSWHAFKNGEVCLEAQICSARSLRWEEGREIICGIQYMQREGRRGREKFKGVSGAPSFHLA